MDFAARRYALEMQRRGLVKNLSEAKRGLTGAIPLSWQSRQPKPQDGELMEKSDADELRQIDVALARLREGSYGFCQICGEDIDDARLDENPAAPFCGKCGH